MGKALPRCLFAVILLSQVITGLAFSPSEVNSQRNGRTIEQSNGIIVDGTDYNSTFAFEYSMYLLNVTKDLTSRVVAEYGEVVVMKALEVPRGLPSLSPRIVVEYADTAFQLVMQSSTRMELSERVIVEYAEYTARLRVSEWRPWDVNADGIVNIVDVTLVAARFTLERDEPKWDGRCDLDLNGIINIVDVSTVAKHFMQIGIDP